MTTDYGSLTTATDIMGGPVYQVVNEKLPACKYSKAEYEIAKATPRSNTIAKMMNNDATFVVSEVPKGEIK